MQAARAPPRGVHSAGTNGQRTRPGKSFPTRRACACRDCLWGRLHEPHGPFLLELRTHVAGGGSSSFSYFSMIVRTRSLVSNPSMCKQEKLEKFPNSVKCV